MRKEIIDIKDLSDSREVMMKKTPISISLFVLIVTFLLVLSLVWAYFGKIDMYFKATGEIRPVDSMSTVTSSGGKILSINVDDGDIVNKGDLLIQFDCDALLSQKENAMKLINNKKIEIDNNIRLIEAITNDNNTFDEKQEAMYYFQYKGYESEVNNVISQSKLAEKEMKNALNEIELALSQTEKTLTNTNVLLKEYKEFYNIIKNKEAYAGANQSLKDIYLNYKISLDKAQSVYDSCLTQYNFIKKQHDDNPQLITAEQVEQALFARDSSFADVQSITLNLLIQINEAISAFEQEVFKYKLTIESYTAQKNALIPDDDIKLKAQQVKDRYFLSINNNISSLHFDIDNINEQILSINNSIASAEIKAETDGVFLFGQEIYVGDIISSGVVIGRIMPNEENYETVVYIPECNISEVEVGQKVEYVFSSLSHVEYSKVSGTITYISKDSFFEQATGQKFYKATATLDKILLRNDNGETRKIQNGMMVEVHAITGERTVLNWFLDKMNFV